MCLTVCRIWFLCSFRWQMFFFFFTHCVTTSQAPITDSLGWPTFRKTLVSMLNLPCSSFVFHFCFCFYPDSTWRQRVFDPALFYGHVRVHVFGCDSGRYLINVNKYSQRMRYHVAWGMCSSVSECYLFGQHGWVLVMGC